jgi:glucose-6-phosphate dehydrogenase assembly protein OpcA
MAPDLTQAHVRAATMTIVVFFEDAQIGKLARERIGALAAKHPSRVIVLDGTRDEPVADGNDDWIETGARDADGPSLAQRVASLRLREAPVVLLWVARGIGDDERFCALAPEAQTVVYNSSLVDDGSGALCELVDYVAEHPRAALSDIAYLRLAPWQESIAILFDGDEAVELERLRRVEVECGSQPEGLYLLGWLASRLGWTVGSSDAFADRQGRRIEFAIRQGGNRRRVRRVQLESSESTFAAQADADGASIHLNVMGGRTRPARYRAVHDAGISALVERAILTSGHDTTFAAALAVAGDILSRRSDAR